ncbi:DUF4064 domain-containing protein [Bacillus cereus group sp. BfR-BA-01380]|uniref:DUF4064 domain-containing protein n=1 Tax=Bacillus cereus group sp. BfR-BA-01380 TaxID=2920324 RepID=UPI001F58B37D|nr:DUF4064 domain-containing protein [Bacillus cereus group sp. BfR-BA-01380]
MKRTAEFITGLIGGIFGCLLSLFIGFCLVSYAKFGDSAYSTYGDSVSYANSEGSEVMIILFSIALIIQIGLLVLACCVNKVNNIAYGVCMIVLSIISLLLSVFILLIPVVLQIVSGALAFRTLQQKSN